MPSKKRIVVKIGSSLLANPDLLTPRWAFMQRLLEDITKLRNDGYEVVLCSSGAVALGLNMLNEKPETAGLRDKQAAAACGMPLLLNAYKQVAHEFGFDIAQVLVTLQDMEERKRFLNTKNTVHRLLQGDILPIVNENDSITTEEIRVGDNDRLAAKVAQMIQADHLVILTCIDGLYDKNPEEPGAQLVEEVHDVSEYIAVTEGTSSLGSGGMLTKMQAANMAQNAGCTTLIANGEHDAPVSSVLYNERPHTKCIAHTKPASAWATWLTDRLQIAGSIVIRDELANTLADSPEHVLHEDIKSIQGQYLKGDVIHVYDESGAEIARGMTNFSSEETMVLARHPEISPKELLGYQTGGTVISRENLIVLEDRHLLWDKPEEETMVEVSES
ncbi:MULTISPECIES: glutamate 5-kinase [unclassified Hyphomonas]|uniref:Glutamate 5-kinase / RNA-binding C-terminal domain PUA n=1 Tax=hydrothermal vent metagenome TaxID=652676 RepID=A0A160TW87_9ZZZZ|nr:MULTISPECIES: glutamate 5-kinase [unclassified Hyphomonas]MAN89686.1 glutamate 5-kinase [Hyphomonadaceae bacterium]MAA83837.1 glutamate 5-kinase [Hyphomonas sp.]MAL43196.1 glutamate 5-kinase [Hyphomonas sp.]MAX84629.1 glutamate 5-kinase [Hyphomonas sp.]MBO6582053.1 glutamate 5-kinase [Hyphomonas sp.]